MTTEPRFSVIIPSYNREERIDNALRSLLAQTYPHFEVIVVDDGSTDHTAEIVKGFSDARIKYIFQQNQERGAARNTGSRIATGDFITFLDSDDEFLPNHLETVSNFIQSKENFDVFCTSYIIKSPKKNIYVTMPENIRKELIHGNYLSCNGVFLRKETAVEFLFSEDRELSGLEDWELWLRIASKKPMTVNKTFTSQMNQHDDRSVLQTTKIGIENRFDSFYKHVFLNHDIVEYYKGRLHFLKASGETYMALHLALTKKYRSAALKHFLKGLATAPSVIFTRRFYAILKHLL